MMTTAFGFEITEQTQTLLWDLSNAAMNEIGESRDYLSKRSEYQLRSLLWLNGVAKMFYFFPEHEIQFHSWHSAKSVQISEYQLCLLLQLNGVAIFSPLRSTEAANAADILKFGLTLPNTMNSIENQKSNKKLMHCGRSWHRAWAPAFRNLVSHLLHSACNPCKDHESDAMHGNPHHFRDWHFYYARLLSSRTTVSCSWTQHPCEIFHGRGSS